VRTRSPISSAPPRGRERCSPCSDGARPEIRHLRRWLSPIMQELDLPARSWRDGSRRARPDACSVRRKSSKPIATSKSVWSREENAHRSVVVDTHLHIVWTEAVGAGHKGG